MSPMPNRPVSPSLHESALNAGERSARSAKNSNGIAKIRYHPSIDVITVTVGHPTVDLLATWFGGYLTQSILMSMPSTEKDRLNVGIANPKQVLHGDTPDVRVLRALLGDTAVGGVRGVVGQIDTKAPAVVKATVSVGTGQTESTLRIASEIIADIVKRDIDPNFELPFSKEAGVYHDPLFSSLARLVIGLPTTDGVFVSEGDLTVEDIGAGVTSQHYGPDGFPQRERLFRVEDIGTPSTPDYPGALGFD